MEDYEITQGAILNWATSFASYDELEQTAKAIYKIYKEAQKKEDPEKYKVEKKSRKTKPAIKKKAYQLPKGYRKYYSTLKQNTKVPYTEIRR